MIHEFRSLWSFIDDFVHLTAIDWLHTGLFKRDSSNLWLGFTRTKPNCELYTLSEIKTNKFLAFLYSSFEPLFSAFDGSLSGSWTGGSWFILFISSFLLFSSLIWSICVWINAMEVSGSDKSEKKRRKKWMKLLPRKFFFSNVWFVLSFFLAFSLYLFVFIYIYHHLNSIILTSRSEFKIIIFNICEFHRYYSKNHHNTIYYRYNAIDSLWYPLSTNLFHISTTKITFFSFHMTFSQKTFSRDFFTFFIFIHETHFLVISFSSLLSLSILFDSSNKYALPPLLRPLFTPQ